MHFLSATTMAFFLPQTMMSSSIWIITSKRKSPVIIIVIGLLALRSPLITLKDMLKNPLDQWAIKLLQYFRIWDVPQGLKRNLIHLKKKWPIPEQEYIYCKYIRFQFVLSATILKHNTYQVFVSDLIVVGLKFCSIIRRELFSPNKMEVAMKKQRRKK